MFLRSTKKEEIVSTDQLNHEKYRREVFLPYIESTRANYLQCEGWEPGDAIEDDHLWVNWQDGHGPGLKAIISNKQMNIDASLKVMANKHASSTSTITQMADLGRNFAIMKSKNKTTTSNYLPSGYGLKGQVEYKLDRLQSSGILVLKTPIKKPS